MMRLCTALILMLALYQVDSSDRLKVFGNLHETSSLPCPETCSGLLTWTTLQRWGDVLVRCTRDSCWSKDGFSLPLEQFLSGDSTLTVLRADYSLRGLYMAKCDSETLCEVVFTLSPQETSRNITPGEPIDVHLPLTDLVEVRFTPSDAVQPSNLQICNVSNEKIHCSPDYKERASRLNTLQIKDGRGSDSGIYTVRDRVNEETLAIVHVHVGGVAKPALGARPRRSLREPCPDSKHEGDVVLIVLLVLVGAVLVVVSVMYLRL
ncbi:uncharacterized protein Hap1MRO34_023315 [Clarias gariepinus]